MPRRKVPVLVALTLIILVSLALGVRIERARAFEPMEPTMAEDTYVISLDEAVSRRYNFSFWLPSGIPENYNWTSVMFFGVDPSVPDSLKKTFVAERVFLLYSTHPLNMSMTLTEFRSKYSTILVNEVYATGENTSAGGNPTYLEGYPASIKPNSAYIFKFDEHTVYTITSPPATLSQEQLLTIAKSLITRPYQIQVVTSTQTITSTSTYATMTITATTTTQTETTTEPTTYAWAVAATTVAVLLAIILLRSMSKSNI
ncbi:MAG: hypothetical protein M1503_01450 [Thaumarchaeota archaeon]|nr:hypothetical protein [Nitrososphaerota archaeon]